jgi:sugar phosphate isomerase/epimerase
MDRREFISRAVAALAVPFSSGVAAKGVKWEVGCFNRPWTKWPFDRALREVKAAGYSTVGLLSRTREEPFIGAEATPEYLAGLKRRIAASGLRANMGALRSRHNVPHDDSVREVRTQIDNARTLSLKYVLSFGADRTEEYAHYFRVMREAAAYAEDKGIKLVMKPHGGISGSSGEILRAIAEVGHPNFAVWYDAGNIIHYTGKDPAAELGPVARRVTGFCAKDCGELKGDVMIQFGAGKVDFPAVLGGLKAAGFKGPVMVEGCKVGQTPEETTANARANREFIERVLRSL